MNRCGFALAILIGVSLPSSAWAISQGSSCRLGARAQNHSARTEFACWLTQDPWQDCDEDPWQLSSEVSSRDTFSDPWQDGEDPWQPFVAPARTAADVRPDPGEDPWQVLRVQVVKLTSASPSRDFGEDPVFADPWQDDVEDTWQ